MKKFITTSAQQTKHLAKTLAEKFDRGVIALSGDLGSGKTTFVQGFAKGLGIKDKIISPTFILIRQHLIPNTKKVFYHIDLYRLEKTDQLFHIGIEEIIKNPNNIIIIEWADKAKKFLPKNTIYITFEQINENSRKIKISNLPSYFHL